MDRVVLERQVLERWKYLVTGTDRFGELGDAGTGDGTDVSEPADRVNPLAFEAGGVSRTEEADLSHDGEVERQADL